MQSKMKSEPFEVRVVLVVPTERMKNVRTLFYEIKKIARRIESPSLI
jgi:hypothetical protein